jgi:type IV pilus assembly protein PilE
MQKRKGFTLIELMIAVVIVGILASIAIPSYRENVRKGRRSDAEAALSGLAGAMERHYSLNYTYCDAADATGAAVANCGDAATNDDGAPSIFATQSPIDGSTQYYNLTIAVGNAGTTYTLSATPINDQAADRCGTLTLTNAGVRGAPSLDVATCWTD